MNKRATIMDILLTPTFVTIVALGFVLLTLLGAIYRITSPTEYEENYYAAETALLITAEYALRKDANIAVQHQLEPKFGLNISSHKVKAYTKQSLGAEFLFDESPQYTLIYKTFPPTDIPRRLVFYRTGNKAGVENGSIAPNLNTPYCEREILPRLNVEFPRVVIGNQSTNLATGDAIINGRLTPGTPEVKLYINPRKESEQIACKISQLMDAWPVTIIPVNTKLIAQDNPLKTLDTTKPAIFIEAYLPDDITTKSKLQEAIRRGVETHG